jgi:hypothetical protein
MMVPAIADTLFNNEREPYGLANGSQPEGQTLHLNAGDSWLVPAGAAHHYTIVEPFTAIEATAPPAEVHGRDAPN